MMQSRQRYRCQKCAAEIEITKDSMEGRSNPRCCCGGEMKKPYAKPVLITTAKDAPIVAHSSVARDMH
jgi:hypothetical protein